ncbi:unnamed protein product [Phytophthora lilii]|uniref:Unnamed protein product n=1 Tax=Phytophthora lilii TaxID=2077276 RepID=A0A9W6TFD0_9STRA|nr:unnamed protein product [Phytophthora lilii]
MHLSSSKPISEKQVKDVPMPSKQVPAANGSSKTIKAPPPKSPSKPTARSTPSKLLTPAKAQSVQPPPPLSGEEQSTDGMAPKVSVVPTTEESASSTIESPANAKIEDLSTPADGQTAVVEPPTEVVNATEAAAATEEIERLRKLNGTGMVKLIYENYDELFPIEDGSTTQAIIDEVYCLSFVMPNCLVRLSRHPNPERFQREETGIFDSPVREDPRGTYHDLEKDQTYYVVVEQEADQLRRDQEATKAHWDGELQKQKKADKDDGRGFESCSCIYGNPCVDEYGCRDWHSRFAVATKNGWKGF